MAVRINIYISEWFYRLSYPKIKKKYQKSSENEDRVYISEYVLDANEQRE